MNGQAKVEILDSQKNCTYSDRRGQCGELLDAFSGVIYRRGENVAEIGKSEANADAFIDPDGYQPGNRHREPSGRHSLQS